MAEDEQTLDQGSEVVLPKTPQPTLSGEFAWRSYTLQLMKQNPREALIGFLTVGGTVVAGGVVEVVLVELLAGIPPEKMLRIDPTTVLAFAMGGLVSGMGLQLYSVLALGRKLRDQKILNRS